MFARLDSAPFPHPKRAEGHNYKKTFFPATQHYADNTVAIFVPKSLEGSTHLDFVVHFHGWRTHVETVLRQFKLIEQLAASERSAVLVVPQGPRDAPDSCGGKMEDPDGFKRLMADVLETLRRSPGLRLGTAAPRNILLSAHSGGYQAVASILDRGGMTAQIAEVWLFDGLYGQTEQYADWTAKNPAQRFINIYTEDGGTKRQTEGFIDLLRQRSRRLFTGTDLAITDEELRNHRLVFLLSELSHNGVLVERQDFSRFLRTSPTLGPLPPEAK